MSEKQYMEYIAEEKIGASDLFNVNYDENGMKQFCLKFDEFGKRIVVHSPLIPERLIKAGDKISENLQAYQSNFHSHNSYMLIVALDGDNIEIVEDEVIKMGAKDLVLLSPCTKCFNFTREKNSRVIFINIHPSLVGDTILPLLEEDIIFTDFFTDFLVDNRVRHYLVFRNVITDEVMNILEGIAEEFVLEQPLGKTRMRVLLMQLLIELARQTSEVFFEKKSLLGRKAMTYLFNHCADISLEELAEKVGYSPKYLSGILRKDTGKGFQELRTEYRLIRANTYLESTSLSVEKVAELCGYQDKAAFYKAYRKKYGHTPRQKQ